MTKQHASRLDYSIAGWKEEALRLLESYPFKRPWWCRGKHAQTVFDHIKPRNFSLDLELERLETPDDDFVRLHHLTPHVEPELRDSVPHLFLLHGLEGCAKSDYIKGMMQKCEDAGWGATVMEYRACGGEMNRAPRFYHSGDTRDFDHALRHTMQRFPGRPFYALGFSLGANVLGKWLGEEGDAAPLRAAAMVSTPFDLVTCAPVLDKSLRGLYVRNFLKPMTARAIEKEKQFPGLIDVEALKKARSIMTFDNLVTAPLHGFKDAQDYYARSGCGQFLPQVRRPTLMISAKDDPLIPVDSLPHDIAEKSPWLVPVFPKHGGHIGFVAGRSPRRAQYWAEEQVMRFFATLRGEHILLD